MLLSKILTLFVMPIGVAGIAGALALAALACGRHRVATGLIAFAIVWLWSWSMPCVADRVGKSLAERFPPRPVEELPVADAIVVLGGPDGNRVWQAARLYRAGKAPLIIATGGRVWPGSIRSPARIMHDRLRALGVPDRAIVVENESRNTRQNALFVAELAASWGVEKVLLVTSAWHMPRAAATFGRTALQVIEAAPMQKSRRRPWILQFLPTTSALSYSTAALREYLGLLVYRARGWA